MTFQGSVITEQGVTFAIVIVKKYIVDNPTESDRVISAFHPIFGNIPIVLMAQDSSGVPYYRSRQDIVGFLASVPIDAIPWKEYTI